MSTVGGELGGVGLEDGELEESDVEEGTYVPLARPDNFNPPSLHSMHIQDEVSDSPEDASSSSGSDSDAGRRAPRPKRSKLRPRLAAAPAPAKKKYDIWCTAVQEQVLTEDMVGCDVTKTRKYGVESYDYTIKYRLGENCISKPFEKTSDACADDNDQKPAIGNKRSHADRKSAKLRLGKRENSHRESMETREARVLADLVATERDPPEIVAGDIADNLKEEKKDLLLRIVEVIGPERAIQLYQETKRIEEDGGILVMNGYRRRTPGGVYIFILKRESWVTPAMMSAMFREERAQVSKQRKRRQAATRNHKVQQLKQTLTESELPALLSRSETALVSTEHGSNPPPSPATDARDGSSDTDTPSHTDEPPPDYRPSGASQPPDYRACGASEPPDYRASARAPADYDDDDFLEVNCTDEMDLF